MERTHYSLKIAVARLACLPLHTVSFNRLPPKVKPVVSYPGCYILQEAFHSDVEKWKVAIETIQLLWFFDFPVRTVKISISSKFLTELKDCVVTASVSTLDIIALTVNLSWAQIYLFRTALFLLLRSVKPPVDNLILSVFFFFLQLNNPFEVI